MQQKQRVHIKVNIPNLKTKIWRLPTLSPNSYMATISWHGQWLHLYPSHSMNFQLVIILLPMLGSSGVVSVRCCYIYVKDDMKYYGPHTWVTFTSEKTSTITLENCWSVSTNAELMHPSWPRNSTTRVKPKKKWVYIPKDVENVHSSTIPESLKLATNKLVIINIRIKCGISLGTNLIHDAVHENPDTSTYMLMILLLVKKRQN